MAWYKGHGKDEAACFECMLQRIEREGYHVESVYRKEQELCVKIRHLGSYKTNFNRGRNVCYCQLKFRK